MDRYSIALGKPIPPSSPPKPPKPKSLKEQAKKFLEMPDNEQIKSLQSLFGYDEEERQIVDAQLYDRRTVDIEALTVTDHYEPTEADLESLREEAASVAEAADEVIEIVVNGITQNVLSRSSVTYREIIDFSGLPFNHYYSVTYSRVPGVSFTFPISPTQPFPRSNGNLLPNDSIFVSPGMTFDVSEVLLPLLLHIQSMHGITTTQDIEIIVNGRRRFVEPEPLSYREIVNLSGLPYDDHYTVTYRRDPVPHCGDVTSGYWTGANGSPLIVVSPGMIVNVAMTNSA